MVAIEDEETDAKGDATLDGKRPGRIDVVGLQDLYGGASTGVQTIELVDALKALPDAVYPADPQPEFVAMSPDGRTAAVTLQENNAVALIDLGQPRRAGLLKLLTMGTVVRNGNADLQKDKEILLKDSFTGRREADAVSWVSNEVFALANEGDGQKDKAGVLPGGRGFTLMNIRGEVVHETGERTEQHAVQHGHYPRQPIRRQRRGNRRRDQRPLRWNALPAGGIGARFLPGSLRSQRSEATPLRATAAHWHVARGHHHRHAPARRPAARGDGQRGRRLDQPLPLPQGWRPGG